MGIDTIIKLPTSVGIENVANTIGALAGLPVVKIPLGQNSYYAKTQGVCIEHTSVPYMQKICLEGNLIDGQNYHYVLYFFESSSWDGILLNPPSTNFWVAVAKRLVDIFGGEVDYNDCDDIKADYTNSKFGTIDENRPSGGESWKKFQDMLLNIKPITQNEMNRAFS